MNKLHIIIPAAALLVGVGIGAASASGGAPAASASTAAPAACLEALDAADLLIGTSNEVITLVGEHLRNDAAVFGGMADGNYTALREAPGKMQGFTTEINRLTERIKDHKYGASADRCRGK